MIRNLAGQTIGAELVNATTGAAFAGAVTVYVTIDAGVQAIGSVGGGACTLEGNGFYSYLPSQAETDGQHIAFTFTGTGAVPATVQVYPDTVAQAAVVGSTLGSTSAVSFSATTVIQDAFLDLGIFAPGESIPPEHSQFALRALNRVISGLQLQPLSQPFTAREVFSLVAGQSTYTIGPGGDFNTVRPVSLEAAGLLMPTQGPTIGSVEIPRAVLEQADYENIRLKDLQNPMFTAVFYDATYASGLGSIYVWPTPSTTLYQLVLYTGSSIIGFANLTTVYDFPPGYLEMLQYQLEKRLATPYGRPWGLADEIKAGEALALVKRQNYEIPDLALDTTIFGDASSGYSILQGE